MTWKFSILRYKHKWLGTLIWILLISILLNIMWKSFIIGDLCGEIGGDIVLRTDFSAVKCVYERMEVSGKVAPLLIVCNDKVEQTTDIQYGDR